MFFIFLGGDLKVVLREVAKLGAKITNIETMMYEMNDKVSSGYSSSCSSNISSTSSSSFLIKQLQSIDDFKTFDESLADKEKFQLVVRLLLFVIMLFICIHYFSQDSSLLKMEKYSFFAPKLVIYFIILESSDHICCLITSNHVRP
jgi:hypothetical protein